MTSKSPIFPMPQPQHFSDYGFDPEIDYFRVLEEARKHKRETKPIETLHFKLQKPISKEDSKKKTKKKKWWKNALLFWKWSWVDKQSCDQRPKNRAFDSSSYRAVSGPIYRGESESSTPSRTSRPSSGPLAGAMTPTRKGDVEVPYLSLRELNVDQSRISTSSMPIYLVT